ncbi:hypothetical protein NMY22_g76 [Coprinellus aureogranulatus]|nr:hypothetical protein NMY22_g76 [Coprinellus aureogranulatus]
MEFKANYSYADDDLESAVNIETALERPPTFTQPALWGIPLKYLSLLTLAVQNSGLTLLMTLSRTPASLSAGTYSAATAVLVSELLKGLLSFVFALFRQDTLCVSDKGAPTPSRLTRRVRGIFGEICSSDCWKLAIPAILYVIQNNLQYIAASNLPPATFQVAYQMKILTTALFSVVLLGKRLTSTQWFSLGCLALGVGIIQIQAATQHSPIVISPTASSRAPLKGFSAVTAACFTSGLAGVYFEMVLKNSKTDIWIRNIQLSCFSILPAIVPLIASHTPWTGIPPPGNSIAAAFRNFTPTAWATILVQVLGGLITALVIKYSDNIMKGFATSLSIVISFVASVALFDFQVSGVFILGSSVVLGANHLYTSHPSPFPSNNPTTPHVKYASLGSIPQSEKDGSFETLLLSQVSTPLTASTTSLASTTFPAFPSPHRTLSDNSLKISKAASGFHIRANSGQSKLAVE